MDTKVSVCGVEFKNPIIAASGTFGFGEEYADFYDLSVLGGISSKGLTPEPRQGNASPRIAETPSGILNSVGLQNPGVEAFVSHHLPFLQQSGARVIANVAGHSKEDYIKIVARLATEPVDLIEVNISCPNVKEGGMAFGVKPESVYEITQAVKAVSAHPIIMKLSPNVADIRDNARAAEEGGADAVSLINTLTGMAVSLKTKKPILANTVGGLSGACVKPIALRMVHQVYQTVKIPIIGMGGIMNAQDVLEFMMCGATAVMVGTANLINPYACQTIVNNLTKEMQKYRIEKIADITGTLQA